MLQRWQWGPLPSAPLYPDAGPGREKNNLQENECDILKHTVQNLEL